MSVARSGVWGFRGGGALTTELDSYQDYGRAGDVTRFRCATALTTDDVTTDGQVTMTTDGQ